MVIILRFEDSIAWQKARIFVADIYRIMKDCKDYSFRDQIQRAAVSILNNIAEGFERNTNKEMRNFLYIAKGSAGETRSMLLLGNDLGYLDDETSSNLVAKSEEISKILSGLIKTL